jgi:simple sugar transport system permease protein
MRIAPLPRRSIPRWADVGLIPVLNIALALGVSGLVIALLGENPLDALTVMLKGAFVYPGSLGYTLYYTTNFIFTGLAVSIAFHAMLFNIGGEGQAAIGGLGVALVVLALDSFLPGGMVILLAIAASAAFGAGWALIPAYLQAYRGSHIVITTIMFNFIAAGLTVALLTGVLMRPGQSSPQTREFAEGAQLPFIHDMLNWVGIETARSPLNLSFVIALGCCVGVWVLIWRTRFGYALRAMGRSEPAAVYAGIPVRRMVVIAMALSGGMAGMMALNEILGVQHKLAVRGAVPGRRRAGFRVQDHHPRDGAADPGADHPVLGRAGPDAESRGRAGVRAGRERARWLSSGSTSCG